MANCSSDLLWQVTKKYNSFLVQRKGVSFSCEPGNATNLRSAKYSGLSNNKTVDVKGAGDFVSIQLKKTKDQNKPNKYVQNVKVKSADPKRVERVVQKLVGDSHYKPALAAVAVKRAQKISQAGVRAQRLSKGKLVVKFGRNAKPFPYNGTSAAKKTKKADAMEEEDLPALAAPATTGEEMD